MRHATRDASTSVNETVSFPAPGPHQRPAGIMPLLRDPAWHLTAVFAVAIALGGSGVGAGMANLVVQLGAILVMALHPRAFTHFFLRRPDWLTALVALSLLLVLVQLVPLPPSLWSAFPGRDLVSASLERTRAGRTAWFPLSLDRGRTLTSLMGTLLPMSVIVVGSVLPSERLRWLVGIVTLLGAAAMVYGVLVLLAPQNAPIGVEPAMRRMDATFADWNAAALFFDACLLLLVGLLRPGSQVPSNPVWLMLRAASTVLLLVGVFLTQSRSGTVLLAAPLALLTLLALRRKGIKSAARASHLFQGMLAFFVLTGLVVGTVAMFGNSRLSASFDRFAAGDGKRAEMREDALAVAKRYWPVGAGMGTFDEVFQVDESLEYLSPRTAGRAHMDYYELTIEAGVAGLALLVGWIAWVLTATWKALRQADYLALAGAGVIACCAMQSILSFPLRNQTMLAMVALAVVLLAHALRDRRRPS